MSSYHLYFLSTSLFYISCPLLSFIFLVHFSLYRGRLLEIIPSSRDSIERESSEFFKSQSLYRRGRGEGWVRNFWRETPFIFGTGGHLRHCVRVRARFLPPAAGRPSISLSSTAYIFLIFLHFSFLFLHISFIFRHISVIFSIYSFTFPSYFVILPPYFFIFPETLEL